MIRLQHQPQFHGRSRCLSGRRPATGNGKDDLLIFGRAKFLIDFKRK